MVAQTPFAQPHVTHTDFGKNPFDDRHDRRNRETPVMKHVLPPLPYAVSALEPYIEARTMTVHHDKHHAGYIKALNAALETGPSVLQGKTACWLLRNPDQVPEKIRTVITNNAGGHLNHCIFWHSMSPDSHVPSDGALAQAIDQSFGSLANFKSGFEEAGRKLFGSGWVWLVKSRNGDDALRIMTTNGHENPMTRGYEPLLVNDVWEHAYYLQHENRRAEYLNAWWSVTNWKQAEIRLEGTGIRHGKQPCEAGQQQPLA